MADDNVLIAESKEDLQEMINELHQKCVEYGMSLNAKKTKVMAIDKKEQIECEIKVENKELEQGKEYKYLGSNNWIVYNGKCEEEVRRRIGKTTSNFWKFKEFLRSNINLNLKLRLLKTCIFPGVGYGSKTWTYSKVIKEKFHAFEM